MTTGYAKKKAKQTGITNKRFDDHAGENIGQNRDNRALCIPKQSDLDNS